MMQINIQEHHAQEHAIQAQLMMQAVYAQEALIHAAAEAEAAAEAATLEQIMKWT